MVFLFIVFMIVYKIELQIRHYCDAYSNQRLGEKIKTRNYVGQLLLILKWTRFVFFTSPLFSIFFCLHILMILSVSRPGRIFQPGGIRLDLMARFT